MRCGMAPIPLYMFLNFFKYSFVLTFSSSVLTTCLILAKFAQNIYVFLVNIDMHEKLFRKVSIIDPFSVNGSNDNDNICVDSNRSNGSSKAKKLVKY